MFQLGDDVNNVVNGEAGESLESEEIKRAKVLEVQAVRTAESGNLSEALQLLNQAVIEAPNYASVYNNRAQVKSNMCQPTHESYADSLNRSIGFKMRLIWHLPISILLYSSPHIVEEQLNKLTHNGVSSVSFKVRMMELWRISKQLQN